MAESLVLGVPVSGRNEQGDFETLKPEQVQAEAESVLETLEALHMTSADAPIVVVGPERRSYQKPGKIMADYLDPAFTGTVRYIQSKRLTELNESPRPKSNPKAALKTILAEFKPGTSVVLIGGKNVTSLPGVRQLLANA